MLTQLTSKLSTPLSNLFGIVALLISLVIPGVRKVSTFAWPPQGDPWP